MKIGKFKLNHYINYMVIGLITLVMGIISLAGGRFDNSLLFLVEKIAISIILAVSLSLVVGFLGELSLGHAGFMCVGAYLGGKIAVLLEPSLGNGPLTLLVSLVVGAAVAAAYGAAGRHDPEILRKTGKEGAAAPSFLSGNRHCVNFAENFRKIWFHSFQYAVFHFCSGSIVQIYH